jgi:hypothetical protein
VAVSVAVAVILLVSTPGQVPSFPRRRESSASVSRGRSEEHRRMGQKNASLFLLDPS